MEDLENLVGLRADLNLLQRRAEVALEKTERLVSSYAKMANLVNVLTAENEGLKQEKQMLTKQVSELSLRLIDTETELLRRESAEVPSGLGDADVPETQDEAGQGRSADPGQQEPPA